jgi:hypothetical protein
LELGVGSEELGIRLLGIRILGIRILEIRGGLITIWAFRLMQWNFIGASPGSPGSVLAKAQRRETRVASTTASNQFGMIRILGIRILEIRGFLIAIWACD